jgi:hypothetical protein
VNWSLKGYLNIGKWIRGAFYKLLMHILQLNLMLNKNCTNYILQLNCMSVDTKDKIP